MCGVVSSMALATNSRRRMEWGEEQEKLLKFMIHGQENDEDCTVLDLLGGGGGSCSSSSSITSSRCLDLELDMELPPPPSGWDKRLDIKNGKFYYVHLSSGRSLYRHPMNAQPSDLLGEVEYRTTKTLLLGLDDLELRLGITNNKNNGFSNIQSEEKVLEASSTSLKQMPAQSKLERPVSSSYDCSSSSSSCCISDSSSSLVGDCNHVVLTTCKRCIMYVMIDHVNPNCPKCSNQLVMDDWHVQQVKKPRTN